MITLIRERKISPDITVEELATRLPPIGWEKEFEEAASELRLISYHLQNLGNFFPPKEDLFSAFDLCPRYKVKVVIIGQDPYHSTFENYPQANGMAFSTRRGCPLQPSIKNIYKELTNEYPGWQPPNHGDLSSWALQGVLLLNTCLTVKPHEPKSHKEIWNGFVAKMLNAVNNNNPECIYMLWGADAIKMATKLGERTIKLVATHPSGFSANRPSKDAPAFIGCGHFKQANEYLTAKGKQPIDWTCLN